MIMLTGQSVVECPSESQCVTRVIAQDLCWNIASSVLSQLRAVRGREVRESTMQKLPVVGGWLYGRLREAISGESFWSSIYETGERTRSTSKQGDLSIERFSPSVPCFQFRTSPTAH